MSDGQPATIVTRALAAAGSAAFALTSPSSSTAGGKKHGMLCSHPGGLNMHSVGIRMSATTLGTVTATAAAAAVACTRRRTRIVAMQSNGRGVDRQMASQTFGNSTAVPFLQIPQHLTNNPLDTSFPGDYGFDPLGFSSTHSSPLQGVEVYIGEVCQNSGIPSFDKLRWYREAELMHGRVAMLASLNIILREFGKVVLPDQALDVGGKLQFLQVMAVFELYRGYRLFLNTAALAGDLGLGMGAGEAMAPDMTRE
eukprot:CAMPEP_0179081762 /NCGR_PEP_ID=MMETSP0796-20121207/36830_1 /TAXON_ID=73915 /ORGANISM="Pyrodinium bahamense, Strain pbaha01" /LENGTH=253 /DNA_ID=CAMNT_0020779149 /DNA_START=67 /DNA_END=825 /DNA_ORIENTATION=+